MNEEKWLACTSNPAQMIDTIRGRVSDRKLRLFAVACCRRLSCRTPEQRREIQNGLEVAERFAEGLATETQLIQVNLIPWDYQEEAAIPATNLDANLAARNASIRGGRCALEWWVQNHPGSSRKRSKDARVAKRAEIRIHTDLLRDIFGNPFRPVTVDPAWQTSTVVALAQAIYDERAFDRSS